MYDRLILVKEREDIMKKKMLILVYCLAMTLLTSCVPTSNASNTVGVYNEIEIIENTNETINEIEKVIPDEKDIVEFEEPTVVETEEKLIEETEEEVAEEKTKETEETIKEEEEEEIKEEEIPVAPIVTPTPTPTLVPAEKPEVIEEEDKKEVETPTANITIIEDVDLSNDLKALWSQYPDNHFNVKGESYIYYQNQENFVEIHIQKRGDGAYMISGSRTNLGEYMSASQFKIIKKVLETTVEYSDALYAKYIEAYDAVYKNTSDDPQEVAKRIKWRDTNTSFTDGIEKWKTLGNIEYKFELGRGVEMHYRAK